MSDYPITDILATMAQIFSEKSKLLNPIPEPRFDELVHEFRCLNLSVDYARKECGERLVEMAELCETYLEPYGVSWDDTLSQASDAVEYSEDFLNGILGFPPRKPEV